MLSKHVCYKLRLVSFHLERDTPYADAALLESVQTQLGLGSIDDKYESTGNEYECCTRTSCATARATFHGDEGGGRTGAVT